MVNAVQHALGEDLEEVDRALRAGLWEQPITQALSLDECVLVSLESLRDHRVSERVGGRLQAGWHGLVARGRRRRRVRGVSAARRHLAHVSPGPSLSLDLLRLDLLWPRMNGLPGHYPSPPSSYPVIARAYPARAA